MGISDVVISGFNFIKVQSLNILDYPIFEVSLLLKCTGLQRQSTVVKEREVERNKLLSFAGCKNAGCTLKTRLYW